MKWLDCFGWIECVEVVSILEKLKWTVVDLACVLNLFSCHSWQLEGSFCCLKSFLYKLCILSHCVTAVLYWGSQWWFLRTPKPGVLPCSFDGGRYKFVCSEIWVFWVFFWVKWSWWEVLGFLGVFWVFFWVFFDAKTHITCKWLKIWYVLFSL